jgi:hypothetical protein
MGVGGCVSVSVSSFVPSSLLWLAGSGMGVGAGLGEGVGASRYFVEGAVCWLRMGRFMCMPKFLVAAGKV